MSKFLERIKQIASENEKVAVDNFVDNLFPRFSFLSYTHILLLINL